MLYFNFKQPGSFLVLLSVCSGFLSLAIFNLFVPKFQNVASWKTNKRVSVHKQFLMSSRIRDAHKPFFKSKSLTGNLSKVSSFFSNSQ